MKLIFQIKYCLKFGYSIILSILSWIFSKKPKKLIFILGFHRSGSTWLTESMAHEKTSSIIFEPFHSNENLLIKLLYGKNCISPNVSSFKHIEKLLSLIINKKYVSRWSISRTSLRKHMKSDILIVKFIRANFMVNYIHAISYSSNPNKAKYVILVRNPFAVIESVLNGGQGPWNPPSYEYLFSFYELLLRDKVDLLNFIKKIPDNPRFILLIRWCIEYSRLTNDISKYNGNIFYYELLLTSESERERLNEVVDFEVDILSRQSHSSTTSKINNINKSGNYWKSYYDKTDMKIIERILDEFHITAYVPTNYYPVGKI